MGLSLEQKQAMVSEVSAKLSGAQVVLVAEYRGLNVDRVTQLRSKRKAETSAALRTSAPSGIKSHRPTGMRSHPAWICSIRRLPIW